MRSFNSFQVRYYFIGLILVALQPLYLVDFSYFKRASAAEPPILGSDSFEWMFVLSWIV